MPKRAPPPDARLAINQALFDALNKESDRAAVLIGASVLDAQLEDLFRASLLTFTPKDSYESLYGSNGPLATFSARINLAFCLGWISDDLRRDLHTIKDLRNRFAHGYEHDLALANDEFRHLLDGFLVTKDLDALLLRPHQGEADAANSVREYFADPRRRFVTAVGTIAHILGVTRERAALPTGKPVRLVPGPEVTFSLDAGETASIDFKTGTVTKSK